jgi:hypothetical protein
MFPSIKFKNRRALLKSCFVTSRVMKKHAVNLRRNAARGMRIGINNYLQSSPPTETYPAEPSGLFAVIGENGEPQNDETGERPRPAEQE